MKSQLLIALLGGLMACSLPAVAASDIGAGGKLTATGGVTQLEGAAGGGLTPWALIGGYDTGDQIRPNAFYTRVQSGSYHLNAYGAMVGLYDRVELSFARQSFDTEDVGGLLGLGKGYTFNQNIVGAKVRVAGDAILDQDSWLPQIAVGLQYKHNDRGAVLRAIGARHDSGTDFYISATKLFLAQSLLVDGTVRFTKANQIGILGFGGKDDDYHVEPEGSVAYLLSRNFLVGAEYRKKPDNLAIAHEDDWYDLFVAWVPTKNVSLTLAFAPLGNIVIRDHQNAAYLSLQVGF
ncbi:DUF3034 family protein [Nitrospirillum pindoramense]|uniref:DUF3034 family protein n=2 Tax=Nitrospirillum amazonense TaxID=28077 RepID=A0A560GWW3_9PROT|nr:DUF3034 family protein [Nitrospirillum amazonense]